VQFDTPGVTDDARCTVNDVLQNGFETPATYCDLLGCERGTVDHFLSESAQEVEGQHAAQQNNPPTLAAATL
jgi:hypothetical protein